jgi:diguanylate cyclase (GGDEF)-like protein/PAS domain S-box-containing protein
VSGPNVLQSDPPFYEMAAAQGVGLGQAFQDAVTGMTLVDLEGRFRVVNPALCRMLGRSEQELIGHRTVEFTHPDDRVHAAATTEAVLSGLVDHNQVRKRYLRPDGTVVVVVRTTTMMRDAEGRRLGILSQMVDVTEAVAAEEAVARSEMRLRALVARASELTVLVDRDGVVTYASPASLTVLGLCPEDLEGRLTFDLVHPDDLERARASFVAHMTTAGSTAPEEYRFLHRDGSWRHVQVLTSNLLDDPAVGALVVNVRDTTDERGYERRLAESGRWLEALVSASWDIITVHDADGRYRYCSPAVTPQLGYRPAELVGTNALDLLHPDDTDPIHGFREVVAGNAAGVIFEYRMRHRDGSWRWLESTAHNLLEDPAVGGIVITSREVTARRRRDAHQEAIALLNETAVRGGTTDELFTRTVELVAGALDVDHCSILRSVGGKLTVVARHQPALSGTRPAALDREDPDSHPTRALQEGHSIVWGDATDMTSLALHPEEVVHVGPRSGVAALIRDSAEGRGVLRGGGAARGPGAPDDVSFLEAVTNMLAAAIDRRRMEEELRRQASHDQLTGLPNRVLVIERLTQALKQMAHQPGSTTMLFIDTDDFKLINDSLGHVAGDRVVSAVAGRIQDVVRPTDTVARFGGDEFVVLCEQTDEVSASAVAERVRAALAAPILLDERPIVVTASVGIAVTSDPAMTADDLLARADTAMYAAKQAGKDRSAVFDTGMRREVTERLDIATGLRRALANAELRLHYQPVVTAATGHRIGAEALLRWQHPTKGLLGPDRFIGHAEATGLIVPIGAWVIETACEQAAAWQEEGRPASMSINVSGRQLARPDIVEVVAGALQASGVSPGNIVLEVTESAVLSDLDRAARVMTELRDLGVHLGMDDFGTGYSSLSYLANLPFDIVKIDRTFITGYGKDRRTAALLEAMAALCRSLDLRAVAEGVETEAQLAEVSRLGIPYVQGFLFGQPVPANQFGVG